MSSGAGTTVVVADCIEHMRTLPEHSVDAVVCDPPYGLEFMGKEWDRPWAVSAQSSVGFNGREDNLTLPSHRDSRNANCRACGGRQRGANRCQCAQPRWDRAPVQDMRDFQAWCESWAIEALRVLKPGGHLLAFGGTRTYHRLAAGIEDAGFEIRDCLAWMYGVGFPKSLDVSKAIDKVASAEREVVAQWQGWGTALKPAFEPVVVARKPLVGTVAANVLLHGTGALNIDGCRIGTDEIVSTKGLGQNSRLNDDGWSGIGKRPDPTISVGRWPANVVLDEEAGVLLDEQAPNTGGGGFCGGGIGDGAIYGAPGSGTTNLSGRVDANGGASRFFYCAKASSAERQAGLVGCTCETFTEWVNADPAASTPADSATPPRRATTEPSSGDDSEWCTTGYGSKSTDPSPKASTSTTSMATSRTTPSTTSCSSIESRTSDSIPPTSDKTPPTPGSGAAQSARSGSRRTPSTTTSTPRDGCSTADAAPAISQSSSKPSSSAALSACPDCGGVIGGARRNVHPLEPTVKPVDVMRWLIRLVTPPGGTVLDPFTGSGTTGVAAHLEGVEFLGIEREAEYAEIARARIEWWRANSDAGARTDAVLKVERDPAQLDLLGGEAA